MTITNQDIDDAIRTSNTGTAADSPIRALTNALLKALNAELQNTQQDLINKVDVNVFNALAAVARSGSFTDLSDAPQSYGVTGQNDDGFMTQKAVTDALGNKADLEGGKVKLDQLPSGLVSGVVFKGLWDADTNRDNQNAALPNTPVSDGDYYIVSVAGTQFGFTFAAGDWLIADNGAWAQLEPDNLVASVNGQTGVVTINVGVTSIGVTVPTGLSVSGSPVTDAGTIDIALASGYVIPTVEQLQNLGGIEAPAGWQEAGNETKYLAGDGTLKELPSDTQSDWSQTNSNAPDFIKNKPALFDGDYDNLSNKPDIPSKTSDLQNDSSFVTSASLQGLIPKPQDWGDGDKFLAGDGTLKEVQGAPSNPTVTGTYTANGNYNYITMDGINLGEELDLEIGDVVKLKTKTNKIVSGTSGIKWSGVCEHKGRRFYCADGDGIYLENLDGTLKKLSAPNARYTGITSAIYDVLHGYRCLVVCVYAGNIKRFDYDEITEEITAVALTGTNPNRNYTGITENFSFATCVANGDIYSHALIGTTLDEVSAFGGTVKNWGGIYAGNSSVFALDKGVGDAFYWNGSSLQPMGLSSYNLRKMITYDYRCFVYSADGQCYELGVDGGSLTKLPFIPSSDYSDFSGIAFNDGARFIRGDSSGLALSDELTDTEKLHTVEFIGDGETTIGSQLLEIGSIIVNYEHCATRGNGSLKLVTVEDIEGVTIERFKKWHEAPLGLGQAWVDVGNTENVTRSYLDGETRRMMVMVRFYHTSSGAGHTGAIVDGVELEAVGSSLHATTIMPTTFAAKSYTTSVTGRGSVLNIYELR